MKKKHKKKKEHHFKPKMPPTTAKKHSKLELLKMKLRAVEPPVEKPALTPEEIEIRAVLALRRVKANAKKKRADFEAGRIKEAPKPAMVLHTNIPDAPAPKYTYKELSRKESKKGILIFLLRSDNKRLKVNLRHYLRLKRKGKIVIPKPIPALPKHVVEAISPERYFALRIGENGDRVTLLQSMNDRNTDMFVFHHRLGRTMHVNREDLWPSQDVQRAIEFNIQLNSDGKQPKAA